MEQGQQPAQQDTGNGQQPQKVTFDQIRQVQNAIEQCMQLYMQPEKIFAFLKDQAKIEPMFSKLVWAKLEEQNDGFFKQYHLRVQVNEQIIQFNQLLEKQAMMLQTMQQQWMQNITSTANQPQQSVAPAWPLSQPSAAVGAPASIPASITVVSQTPASLPTVQGLSNQPQQQQQQQHFGLQSLPQVLAARSAAAAGPAGLGFMPGTLPHALMPDPAVLATAAAAMAAAAAAGPPQPAAVRARLPMSATTTSTGGTAGCTANTAATGAGSASCEHAAADRCLSATDMIAAWGLGSTSSGAVGQQQTPAAAGAAADKHREQIEDLDRPLQKRQQQQQGTEYARTATAAAAAGSDAVYLAARQRRQLAASAAAAQAEVSATEAAAATAAGSSGYLVGLSSSCDMMLTGSAAEQMDMPSMTKPFSMSDLNALDIPEQLTGVMPGGDLDDVCGMSMGMNMNMTMNLGSGE